MLLKGGMTSTNWTAWSNDSAKGISPNWCRRWCQVPQPTCFSTFSWGTWLVRTAQSSHTFFKTFQRSKWPTLILKWLEIPLLGYHLDCDFIILLHTWCSRKICLLNKIQVMPRCAEFMARCWWRGQVQDCSDLFQVVSPTATLFSLNQIN